jgi:CBS domain-containing protein
MPLDYRVIEIFTSEEARDHRRSVVEEVVAVVKSLRIAARCAVFKGCAGVFESGEIASRRILDISYNMPVKIEIVVPAAEARTVLDRLETVVSDGVVGVRDIRLHAYRTRHRLIPRQLRVRDVMTPDPVRFPPSASLAEVARALMGAVFGAVPIVDAAGRPVGIVTQGDLIYKARMPLPMGLLAESGPEVRERVMSDLSTRTARDVMTPRPVCTGAQDRVTEAVDVLVRKELKRLPVVGPDGLLAGMFSRLDVFRAIAREAPDWSALQRSVSVENLRYVSGIMRTDTQTVTPDTPVEEVIRIVAADDIRRVAVVDDRGAFLGMISDRRLVSAFGGREPGFWEYLAGRIGGRDPGRGGGELGRTLMEKTAGEVMETGLVIVGESTPVEEAVKLMVERRLKRLPVVDAEGRFRGMISRKALLATGWTGDGRGEAG